MKDSTTKLAGNEGLPEFGPDTIEATMRARVRATIEAIVQEALEAALGARKSARVGDTRQGYRHGQRERTLTTSLGPATMAMPRARIQVADGTTAEWRSGTVARYQRRTVRVDEAILGVYLAGTFEAQEQAVVDEGGIVDAVRIDDDGAHHAAQLDQVVPIAAVPRQARRFDTEDRTHLSRADFRDESLESRSLNQTGSRAPQIFVNDHDVLKAQLAGLISQPVLASLTLLVVDDLAGRGLANVHNPTS
jgi:hypothetical protein